MASKAYKKPDEKHAHKIDNTALNILKKALFFTGYPVYFATSRIVIALLFLSYITGHIAKRIAIYLKNAFTRLGRYEAKKRAPKIKKRKITTRPILPRILYFKEIILRPAKLIKIRLKIAVEKSIRQMLKIKRIIIPVKKVFIVFLLLSLLPLIMLFIVFYKLPSPRDLVERDIEVSTKIYDRNGVLLYTIYKDKNRTLVPLDKIPLQTRLATIAIEDAEFYIHPGFSIKGIIRSVIRNATGDERMGGSTITQQLVKNTLLTPEKTLIRKIREVVLAIGVEITYPKDKILEMYLNEVGYGGTAYGIYEASQMYFGKEPKDLTLAESALLAGLPKSPTRYSPFGHTPELAKGRQETVLHLMKVNGFITEDEENTANVEKLNYVSNSINIKAPHFVMYVRNMLENLYGQEVVETGGLSVFTSLDYDIQKIAEQSIDQELEKLKGLNVTNGAVVVLDPKSGEVLAMVGSRNYFDTEHDGNVNVTTSLRQPGSSIKVINYAYALSNGFTPASILSDTPIAYQSPGSPTYIPKNYDGTYRGNLSLRSAFAESRNIPAVRILASYGVEKMIEMGRTMGITSWDDPSHYGLSLTLGGGDVKLIDLAQVYSTVANYGVRPDISPLLKVTNYQGKNLYKTCFVEGEVYAAEAMGAKCGEDKVLDPRVAFLITDILRDNDARAPAFGRYSKLVISGHGEVAVKTGTSNNLRDNLTIGYNQDFLTAVWVGNNDNSPMSRVASGVTGASPIFNRIMTQILSEKSSLSWEVPDGLVNIPICTQTGTLPCTGCAIRNEWFLDENKPEYACKSENIQNKEGIFPVPQILPQAASVR